MTPEIERTDSLSIPQEPKSPYIVATVPGPVPLTGNVATHWATHMTALDTALVALTEAEIAVARIDAEYDARLARGVEEGSPPLLGRYQSSLVQRTNCRADFERALRAYVRSRVGTQ